MVNGMEKIVFSRNQLKWLAVITMIIDHVGVVLVSPELNPVVYYTLRLIGRISFPLFCFMIVQGACYTRNKRKYLLRLFLFALLAEIPFDLAIYGKICYLSSQNVMFTLCIGLAVLFVLEWSQQISSWKIRSGISLLAVSGGMLLAWMIRSDYSYWGVLMILVFYLQRNQKKLGMELFLFLCVIQGWIEMFAATALFFTEHYDSAKSKRFPKYVFYLFYPCHLLILFFLNQFLK